MSSDSIYQLRTAVLQTLNGNAPLLALVTRIYDYLPENPSYPYIYLSTSRANDWSTKSFKGTRIEIRLNTYARDKSSQKCLDIMTKVQDLLHQANLSLTGHTLIDIRLAGSDIDQLLDGLTYRGISRFLAFTQET